MTGETLSHDISPQSKEYALYSLGAVGPLPKEAVPTLFQGMTNADLRVRQAATGKTILFLNFAS